ncbi:V-type ATP synthase subunit I [Halomarina oriensis]|uniref:A-type ATP synthase subunit I n=1 Tax=Halomarina oriensis TaxID=671145 RepID=A0A6B0GL77_9EURY|nr:V-type ATPase 116kDa subunit family protein [Halomarina oriensis]MWG34641.1 V-type ATP synthase subunit I [Halomarina oriensis]
MLRPERMSRVSVTGSKAVMDDVIETVHDLRLLHVTDYDGAWAGFDSGSPAEGADAASEKLVTVRSLQSILGVEDEDAGPARIVTEDALENELEEIRTTVNDLDDQRSDLRDELRAVEDRISTMEPFARLGIDLDLLQGYDSLSVAVGEGDEERVRRALADADVDDYRIDSADGVLAVFARTDDLDDILVSADFTGYAIPDAQGSPDEYLSELEHEREQLQSKLRTVDDRLEEQRLDVGGFLLAAEETLAIDVERREAPLSFATTENAFVAEGWIPTTRFVDLAEGLYEEVGDHVEVDELERAQYDGEGKVISREEVGGRDAPGTPDPTAADGGQVRADGGSDVSAERGVHGRTDTNPPVVQKNPSGVSPYEALVQVINRPKYSEIDPTIFVFLTFPIFFGLMIGDLGYGLLYIALGWFLATRFDSDVVKSLGGVGIFAGVFTAIFGILYGEIFGLHVLGEVMFNGHPPFHKGLQPAYEEYALLWLTVSVLFGIIHLAIGWIVDFYQHLDHGLGEAVLESGSWLVMMFGLWGWIFSYALEGTSPGFMVGEDSVFNGNPVDLGFTGLPAFDLFTIPGALPFVGGTAISAWIIVFLVGIVMLYMASPIEVVEFLNVLVNVLSYTRLAAVLLAKAGMAFVVNLLVFGAYEHDGEWHFIFTEGYSVAEVTAEYGQEALIFPGLVNGEGAVAVLLGAIGGILLLVVGHALVLVLGITSAGLQAVRLEYVEFFGKFFEGGGEEYSPFGYERHYTTED